MMKRNNFILYASVIFFLLLTWHAFALLVRLPFVPPPHKVILHTIDIFTAQMLIHVGYSLWRIFTGIFISVFFGAAIGLCMGYFNFLDRILSPVVYFLYPIPKIALMPLVMLFMGLGEISKISMIVLIVIFQVIVASRDAAKSIPKETFYTLFSLGAGNLDILKRVVLPASLPGLLTSLRVSLATSISVLFFTETYGTQYGMGYFIMDAWMRVNYTDMFSGIIVLSGIGFLLFFIIDITEKIACRWKK